MINKIVFGFGPPKCGQNTAGRNVQKNYGWGHISMRRSIEILGELCTGLDIQSAFKNYEPVDPDVVYGAFVIRMLECSRLENGKTLFVHGMFGGAFHIRPILEYAARFTRRIEVVEFSLSEEVAIRRMLKVASEDARFGSPEFCQTLLDSFKRRLPDMKKVLKTFERRLACPFELRQIDGDHGIDFVTRQLARRAT